MDLLVAWISTLLRYVKAKLIRFKNSLISKFVNSQIDKLCDANGPCSLGSVTVRGVEYRYFDKAPLTLGDFYQENLNQFLNLEFIYYVGSEGVPETRLTYEQVFDSAKNICCAMRHTYGLKKNDVVSILMSNIPEFATSFIATTQFGAVTCTLNAFWEGEELEFGLKDSKTKLLIADEKRLLRLLEPIDLLTPLIKNGLKVVVVRPTNPKLLKFDDFHSCLDVPCLKDFVPYSVRPDDDATLMYTSGTTSGRAKGVVHTHRSMVQTMMCYRVFAELLKALKRSGKHRRCDLMCTPMFHVSALCAGFLNAFVGGHKLVFMSKWNPKTAVDLIVDEKVTFFGGMPTNLSDLLNEESFWKRLPEMVLTNVGTGGAAVPTSLVAKVRQALPHAGQGSGWGMTETNSMGTIIGGPEFFEFPDSVGKPHRIVDVKIVDENGKEIVSHEQAGELCIRTVCGMRCYWNNPQATNEIMLEDGWIRSGDLGTIDSNGFVRVVDRIKDIVIRGGENISLSSVEDAVYSLFDEEMHECSAFGLKHDRLGEELALAVVCREGQNLTAQRIVEACKTKLAKFKVPSKVFVRNEPLPRNGTGKILKRALRKEYQTLSKLMLE